MLKTYGNMTEPTKSIYSWSGDYPSRLSHVCLSGSLSVSPCDHTDLNYYKSKRGGGGVCKELKKQLRLKENIGIFKPASNEKANLQCATVTVSMWVCGHAN